MEGKKQTIITAPEIRFKRQTAKYTQMDYKRNKDILKELKPETTLDKISKYKKQMDSTCQQNATKQTSETTEKLQTTETKELRMTSKVFWKTEDKMSQQ
jgi:hypothetical protein